MSAHYPNSGFSDMSMIPNEHSESDQLRNVVPSTQQFTRAIPRNFGNEQDHDFEARNGANQNQNLTSEIEIIVSNHEVNDVLSQSQSQTDGQSLSDSIADSDTQDTSRTNTANLDTSQEQVQQDTNEAHQHHQSNEIQNESDSHDHHRNMNPIETNQHNLNQQNHHQVHQQQQQLLYTHIQNQMQNQHLHDNLLDGLIESLQQDEDDPPLKGSAKIHGGPGGGGENYQSQSAAANQGGSRRTNSSSGGTRFNTSNNIYQSKNRSSSFSNNWNYKYSNIKPVAPSGPRGSGTSSGRKSQINNPSSTTSQNLHQHYARLLKENDIIDNDESNSQSDNKKENLNLESENTSTLDNPLPLIFTPPTPHGLEEHTVNTKSDQDDDSKLHHDHDDDDDDDDDDFHHDHDLFDMPDNSSVQHSQSSPSSSPTAVNYNGEPIRVTLNSSKLVTRFDESEGPQRENINESDKIKLDPVTTPVTTTQHQTTSAGIVTTKQIQHLLQQNLHHQETDNTTGQTESESQPKTHTSTIFRVQDLADTNTETTTVQERAHSSEPSMSRNRLESHTTKSENSESNLLERVSMRERTRQRLNRPTRASTTSPTRSEQYYKSKKVNYRTSYNNHLNRFTATQSYDSRRYLGGTKKSVLNLKTVDGKQTRLTKQNSPAPEQQQQIQNTMDRAKLRAAEAAAKYIEYQYEAMMNNNLVPSGPSGSSSGQNQNQIQDTNSASNDIVANPALNSMTMLNSQNNSGWINELIASQKQQQLIQQQQQQLQNLQQQVQNQQQQQQTMSQPGSGQGGSGYHSRLNNIINNVTSSVNSASVNLNNNQLAAAQAARLQQIEQPNQLNPVPQPLILSNLNDKNNSQNHNVFHEGNVKDMSELIGNLKQEQQQMLDNYIQSQNLNAANGNVVGLNDNNDQIRILQETIMKQQRMLEEVQKQQTVNLNSVTGSSLNQAHTTYQHQNHDLNAPLKNPTSKTPRSRTGSPRPDKVTSTMNNPINRASSSGNLNGKQSQSGTGAGRHSGSIADGHWGPNKKYKSRDSFQRALILQKNVDQTYQRTLARLEIAHRLKSLNFDEINRLSPDDQQEYIRYKLLDEQLDDWGLGPEARQKKRKRMILEQKKELLSVLRKFQAQRLACNLAECRAALRAKIAVPNGVDSNAIPEQKLMQANSQSPLKNTVNSNSSNSNQNLFIDKSTGSKLSKDQEDDLIANRKIVQVSQLIKLTNTHISNSSKSNSKKLYTDISDHAPTQEQIEMINREKQRALAIASCANNYGKNTMMTLDVDGTIVSMEDQNQKNSSRKNSPRDSKNNSDYSNQKRPSGLEQLLESYQMDVQSLQQSQKLMKQRREMEIVARANNLSADEVSELSQSMVNIGGGGLSLSQTHQSKSSDANHIINDDLINSIQSSNATNKYDQLIYALGLKDTQNLSNEQIETIIEIMKEQSRMTSGKSPEELQRQRDILETLMRRVKESNGIITYRDEHTNSSGSQSMNVSVLNSSRVVSARTGAGQYGHGHNNIANGHGGLSQEPIQEVMIPNPYYHHQNPKSEQTHNQTGIYGNEIAASQEIQFNPHSAPPAYDLTTNSQNQQNFDQNNDYDNPNRNIELLETGAEQDVNLNTVAQRSSIGELAGILMGDMMGMPESVNQAQIQGSGDRLEEQILNIESNKHQLALSLNQSLNQTQTNMTLTQTQDLNTVEINNGYEGTKTPPGHQIPVVPPLNLRMSNNNHTM